MWRGDLAWHSVSVRQLNPARRFRYAHFHINIRAGVHRYLDSPSNFFPNIDALPDLYHCCPASRHDQKADSHFDLYCGSNADNQARRFIVHTDADENAYVNHECVNRNSNNYAGRSIINAINYQYAHANIECANRDLNRLAHAYSNICRIDGNIYANADQHNKRACGVRRIRGGTRRRGCDSSPNCPHCQ